MVRIVIVLSLIAALASRARASPDGVIEGVVEDALMHPLPGATVVLHDAVGNTIARTETGADGKFAIGGLPFGDYTVEASKAGLVPDHQHLQLGSSQVATIELTLVNGEEIVTIHDFSVPTPTRATGSVTAITRQAMTELPGSEDRPITDVVATQPGFVIDALGNIYARGNHANVQYQIDGIPVPDSVGSLFAATIPVRLVQNLEIYTGGMPAEYGERLGAVVNLLTRAAGDIPDGAAQIRYGSYQTIEPGLAYSRKLSSRVGVFAGGSVITSQRALDPPSIIPILHDDGYQARAFARLDYVPCEANRYELFATYAHNRFQVPIDPTVVPLDPSQPNLVRPVDQYGNASPAFVPHDTNATETEDELFVAGAYTHRYDRASSIFVAPLFKLSRGVLFSDAPHALGPLADPGTTASDVTRLAYHGGGVIAYTRSSGAHLFKTGVQLDALVGRTEFTAYARAAGGGVDPARTQIGTDRTDAITTAAYAQDRWTHGKLALDFGLRFDELHVIPGGGGTSDSFGASPRLGASYAISKNTVAHAFAGVGWQPPAPLDAASAARALGVVSPTQAVVYDLQPETNVFTEAGVASRLAPPLRVGLVGWARYAWNQLDDTAIGSTSLLSNYNFAHGRAGGLEVSAELREKNWLSAFANASLGFAQGQGISSAKFLFTPAQLADQSWQTLDHAQTLTANAGATVRQDRFAATTTFAYGSGLRTGPSNNASLPGHARVDQSLRYTFETHGYDIHVAVDILNIFDARYAYRVANGFVGSSYAPPREVFLSLALPLARQPHHEGEK